MDVFLMIRRKKCTIFTDAKENTSVLELKKMVEGILKYAPEDQKWVTVAHAGVRERDRERDRHRQRESVGIECCCSISLTILTWIWLTNPLQWKLISNFFAPHSPSSFPSSQQGYSRMTRCWKTEKLLRIVVSRVRRRVPRRRPPWVWPWRRATRGRLWTSSPTPRRPNYPTSWSPKKRRPRLTPPSRRPRKAASPLRRRRRPPGVLMVSHDA